MRGLAGHARNTTNVCGGRLECILRRENNSDGFILHIYEQGSVLCICSDCLVGLVHFCLCMGSFFSLKERFKFAAVVPVSVTSAMKTHHDDTIQNAQVTSGCTSNHSDHYFCLNAKAIFFQVITS